MAKASLPISVIPLVISAALSKLPGVRLAEKIVFTTDLKEAVEGKNLLVLAVPSVFTRSTAKTMKEFVEERQLIYIRHILPHFFSVFEDLPMENLFSVPDKSRLIFSLWPAGKSRRALWPEPCRRGGKRTSDNLRGRSQNQRSGGICSEYFHERRVSCLH